MKWNKLYEFLYENGYRYIAKDDDIVPDIRAYFLKPEFKENCYYMPTKDDTDKNTWSLLWHEIPIERGECVAIKDLLTTKGLDNKNNYDDVHNPKHYKLESGWDGKDVMRLLLTKEEYKGWMKGNAYKYLMREGKKDDAIKDLRKAQEYIEFMIEEKGKIKDE